MGAANSIVFLGTWPAAWAVLGVGATPAWFVAALVASTLVALIALRLSSLSYSRGILLVSRALLSLGASAFLLLNWLLAVSYYTQATGFNDQLFFHLGTDTLQVGWETERAKLLLQFALLALMPLSVWWVSAYSERRVLLPQLRLRYLAGAFLVVCFVSTPSLNFAAYLSQRQERSVLTADASSSFIPASKTDAKNIVLIYAESLEATYLDSDHFDGELLPQLKALSQDGVVFTDVRQRPGTSWTIAGLIASQCGFSVKVNNPFSGNTRLATTPEPYPDSQCLGDIARQLGYRTLFMGGANSAFAGKGNFLRTHGFERVLGRSELVAQSSEPLSLSPWGVHDDDLFDRALLEIEELEAKDEPYLLSLLTLDTHHPGGFPSPRCELAPEEDTMRRALLCSDQQIASFIRRLRARDGAEDTLIAVFSDHLAMRNSLWDRLSHKGSERRLLFMLFNAGEEFGQKGRRIETPLTHYEIGPTLLEAAGAASTVKIGFGESVFALKDDMKLSALALPGYAEPAEALLLSRGDLVLDAATLSVSLGERVFTVSENGGPFVYGAYTLIFNEKGVFEDVAYTRSVDDIGPSLRGKTVVLLERAERSLPLRYQVGRWGQKTLLQGELDPAQPVIIDRESLSSLLD